jgi:hypothetical protein
LLCALRVAVDSSSPCGRCGYWAGSDLMLTSVGAGAGIGIGADADAGAGAGAGPGAGRHGSA